MANSAYTYYMVKHTDSEYGPKTNELNYATTDYRNNNLQQMRNKEASIYKKLIGADSEEEFFSTIKSKFREMGIDAKILKKFSAEEIVNQLDNNFKVQTIIAPSDIKNYTITLKLINPKQEINVFKGMKDFEILGDEKVRFNVTFQESSKLISFLKNFLNENEIHSKNKKFDIKSLDVSSLSSRIIDAIDIQNPNQSIKDQIFCKSNPVQKVSSIFNAKKKDISEALDSGDTSMIDGLIDNIYSFIYNTLLEGASFKLRKAFRIVWYDNIRSKINSSLRENKEWGYAFFLKGGYTHYLKGAFGEFQSALIFQYCQILFNGSPMATEIANTLESQQGKADVRIFFGPVQAGIQSKNYGKEMNFKINTNAQKMYDNTMQYGNNSIMLDSNSAFFPALINTCFNTNYDNFGTQSYKEQLEPMFAEIASFDMGNRFNNDVVSFYMINGQYLIPVSYIYDQATNEKGTKNVSVSSFSIKIPQAQYKNSDFISNNTSKDYKKENEAKERNLLDSLWKFSGNDNPKPKSFNYADSKNNTLKNVLISGSFKISDKGDYSRYKLF